MSEIDDGGSAFPEPSSAQCGGMSLRDYFAGQALQGMLSNGDWVSRMSSRTGVAPHICASRAAYEVADAMLSARKEQK